jgi:hypothetical protein
MNFLSKTLFRLTPETKKYKKVYILMTGPTINKIKIKELNNLLQEDKCAVIVCNSFFYKNIGLKNSKNIFYANVDPIQIEFFKKIYYSKNLLQSLKLFLKNKSFDVNTVNSFKQNFKSIKRLKSFYYQAKIVDFFTSKEDIKKFISKYHYVAYPKFINGICYNILLRLVMAYHLPGWKKNRPWNFIRNNGFFSNKNLLSKISYLTFMATRNNSFYKMMDLAAHLGAKEIVIAGRSCTISRDLKYLDKEPYLNYQYFYNSKKNLINYPGMKPDYILNYMINLRNYLSSFEDYHAVKVKTYSSDIWAIDRN